MRLRRVEVGAGGTWRDGGRKGTALEGVREDCWPAGVGSDWRVLGEGLRVRRRMVGWLVGIVGSPGSQLLRGTHHCPAEVCVSVVAPTHTRERENMHAHTHLDHINSPVQTRCNHSLQFVM